MRLFPRALVAKYDDFMEIVLLGFVYLILPGVFWIGFADSYYEIKRIVLLLGLGFFFILLKLQ